MGFRHTGGGQGILHGIAPGPYLDCSLHGSETSPLGPAGACNEILQERILRLRTSGVVHGGEEEG